jgi:outer membrane protein OmpA-like peptidoglycan-associated protein
MAMSSLDDRDEIIAKQSSMKRVDAIRDALIQAGVPAYKIHTGAFGEERLKCNESTEACWQRDRRVEVLLSTAN